ncbi:MAG: M15 family metallopeptidase [Oscillospiraceae bacterium]|nr:M15 family metallopeptidase [Oscillospiraceae bacterium]
MPGRIKRILSLILLISMLLPMAASAEESSFSDVSPDAWYAGYIEKMMTETPGVITGYGDSTFRPNQTVKRSEFLRMIAIATQLYTTSAPPSEHWASKYWQMCYENGLLLLDSDSQEIVFGLEYKELEKNLSRYEMAVILANAMQCYTMQETRCKTDGASEYIADYENIPEQYVDAVVQVYGKGIIKGVTNTAGVEDGSFCGHWPLIRSEALAAMYYFLWSGEREPAEFAIEKPIEPAKLGDSEITTFAMKYRYMSTEERRIALFGDAEKTHFTSVEDAEGWMVSFSVNVWRMDKTGNKYSSKQWLTVHELVAEEVKLIFEEIYNDPERFPINGAGGARFTDDRRHSWGCAIDINPEENYYCRVIGDKTWPLAGYGWWPNTNEYSITTHGSVVRAFAKYGWGWGGNGYSGGYYDYMHFSIFHDGG